MTLTANTNKVANTPKNLFLGVTQQTTSDTSYDISLGRAQSFLVKGRGIKIQVNLTVSTAWLSLTASIRSSLSSADIKILKFPTRPMNTVQTILLDFSDIELAIGATYYLVLQESSNLVGITWSVNTQSDSYTDGTRYYYLNSVWTSVNYDHWFIINYSNKIWYNYTQPEVLGTPFSSKPLYARNVWDMQVYDGKIYFGHGNSSNIDPVGATNAGPIPLVYYDPIGSQFVTQNGTYNAGAKTSLDEEQIDIFKVIGTEMYIPGHDTTDDWTFGNWYKLTSSSTTWTKYRNIPNAIHVFDMIEYNGRLFAACSIDIQSDHTSPDVMMSSNGGTTWNKLGTIPTTNIYQQGRVYSLFKLGAKLYAVSVLFTPWSFVDANPDLSVVGESTIQLMEISSDFTFTNVTVDAFKFVYQDNPDASDKLYRLINFNNSIVFIQGGEYNDQQFANYSGSLVSMSSLTNSTQIHLPNGDAVPVDIIVRGSTLYTLSYEYLNPSSYKIAVHKTTDLLTWVEVLEFYYDAFARSFEEINGDFYFGLGCMLDNITNSTGTILRVKGTSLV